MSLFRSQQRHDPAPVTGQVLLDIFGKNSSTAAGVDVSEKNALGLTAVWRAVALLSGTVASLPLKTYTDRQPDDRKANKLQGRVDELVALRNDLETYARVVDVREQLNHIDAQFKEALDELLEVRLAHAERRLHETKVRVVNTPNPTQTGFELRERQTAHLSMWGNSYSLKIRDGSNRVVELWPMIPDYVRPKLKGDKKVFEINPPNGDRIITDASEVLHIPGFGYDGVKGLSPIQQAKEALASGIASEKYSSGIFKSGAMAGGLITTPRRLTSDQAKNIKTRWKDQIGGVENAYEIGVLDQGMKFERLTMPPTDIQFIESRRFSVVEVARLYGVPPHLLMDVERSTSWGTGIEEQTIGFVVFTLQPGYLNRMESRYTREIVPANQYAEFKVDGLLRGSSKVRADVYTKALDPVTGWMSREEVRALENLPSDPHDPNEEPEELPGAPELDSEEAESASLRRFPIKQPAKKGRSEVNVKEITDKVKERYSRL